MSAVSVVIPHYFAERAPHLRRIATDLWRSSVQPAEILVWNNDTADSLPDLAGLGVTILQGHENGGCQARLLAAQRAAGTHVLFLDNDTTVERETIANLLGWARRLPETIVTLEGRVVQPGSYRRWPKYYGRQLRTPQRVDLSLGRGELVPTAHLPALLALYPFGQGEAMDDLWWSACAAWTGCPVYVVPCRRRHSALIDLPRYGTGISATPDYYAARDRAVAAIRTRADRPEIWAHG